MSTDVNLFFLREERDSTSALRKAISTVCESRGWHFHPRSVTTIRAPSGRPIPLIARDVAMGLYPRVHRSRVATLVVGRDPRVALDPNQADALKFNRHVPLRRFVEYKGCWVRIANDSANESWVGAFASWCKRIECEGEHDPRCLPFHVFSGVGVGLENRQRRRSFDDQYGFGADRTDDKGTRWVLNTHDYHGSDSLQVAGYQLRKGCHWDVTAEGWRISTPVAVWRVDGHVNIYPDAHVRARGSGTRKIA